MRSKRMLLTVLLATSAVAQETTVTPKAKAPLDPAIVAAIHLIELGVDSAIRQAYACGRAKGIAEALGKEPQFKALADKTWKIYKEAGCEKFDDMMKEGQSSDVK
jgi:hypothetical protein